jgi:hypothetical protein
MRFFHHNLGQRSSGEVVEVTLRGNAAYVRLMDSSNFYNYKQGRDYKFYGGLVKNSPICLEIPYASRWHMVVDLKGLGGNVRAAVQVLSPTSEASDNLISTIPEFIKSEYPYGLDDNKRDYNVFIVHAPVDKDKIVRLLVNALQDKGLSVLENKFEVQVGDNLRQNIDHGFVNCEVGLIILSRAFLAQGWTNDQLDGIVTRAVTEGQILLPIWHKLSRQDVIELAPSLIDRVAISTTTHTVEDIAAEIAVLLKSFRAS